MDRGELHRLSLLLKALRDTISAAGKATVDAIGENTKAAEESAKQTPPYQPSRITVDIKIPSEETNRYYTEQRKSYRLQWWTFWATVATFVAVAIYAGITYMQWHTMNATYIEITKQSRAAADSAKAAQDANRLTEESIRGRIAIKNYRFNRPVSVGSRIAVVLETENVGHATALERSGTDAKRWRELPEGPMPIAIPAGNTVVEPGSHGTIIVTDSLIAERDFVASISGNLNRTAKESPTVYFFGRIVYTTLGREHYTEFCAFIVRYNTVGIPNTSDTASIVRSDTSFILRECPKWHDAN
jgi:hypothetical protein